MAGGRGIAIAGAALVAAVVGVVALTWNRGEPATLPSAGAGAGSAPGASASGTAIPWTTPRMRREVLRAKILTAILDEASAPPSQPELEPEKEQEPGADGGDGDGEHYHRALTKALNGVPAGNFPTEYIAEIYRDQLGPMTRKCLADAREKHPDAGGEVTVRYVVIAAPGIGGVVEDATVDESSLNDDDLEECIHESALLLTFDRTPDHGGWKEAGFVMAFGADGGG